MGLLYRMFAPRSLKKVRRAAHPVSMVTPRSVKRAKMVAVNTANPVGAAKRAAKTASVHAVRGTLASRPINPRIATQVSVEVAAPTATRGAELGVPPMEFATDQHRIEFERIAGWLEQLFGESAQPLLDDRPHFQVKAGAETVLVHLLANRDGGVLLNLRTWPCDRLKAPDSALRQMLELNARSPIGNLVVEGLGEVEFVYTALAENLTKDTFAYLFDAFVYYASEARTALATVVT